MKDPLTSLALDSSDLLTRVDSEKFDLPINNGKVFNVKDGRGHGANLPTR